MLSPILLEAATTANTAINTSDPSFKISVVDALIFSAIGLGIVFAVLLILNLFIRLLSVVVRSIEGASKSPESKTTDSITVTPITETTPTIPQNMKPADGSLGEVKLYNVDDATAAMIMAIVADQLKMPLNELRFISIKEVTK